jgi:uncharacterized protein
MGDDNWKRMGKFMSAETLQSTFYALAAIRDNQDKIFSIVLHGGEPLLLGAAGLFNLLSGLRQVLSFDYPISIQTNGILISNEILDVCSTFKVSVAVSVDGPKHIHDKLRVTHNGEGTFDAVIAGINMLSTHSDSVFLNAGLLAVIDPESDPKEVYNFFKEIEAPSVDFLYKDGNHDCLPVGKINIQSTEYGEWMLGLLNAYLADSEPLPIRVLDDMLKVLLGGIVSKEGLGLTDFGIIIIDTDGTVMKNDTLKSSYNGADKFEEAINVKDNKLIDFLRSPAFEHYRQQQRPANQKCLDCPQLNICGGGMILHRWKSENAFNNPSVYCADQLHLIEGMRNALSKIYLKYA